MKLLFEAWLGAPKKRGEEKKAETKGRQESTQHRCPPPLTPHNLQQQTPVTANGWAGRGGATPEARRRRRRRAAWRMELLIDSGDVGPTSANHWKEAAAKNNAGLLFVRTEGPPLDQIMGQAADGTLPSAASAARWTHSHTRPDVCFFPSPVRRDHQSSWRAHRRSTRPLRLRSLARSLATATGIRESRSVNRKCKKKRSGKQL